jgi:peptidoglycan lytic transglycosylase
MRRFAIACALALIAACASHKPRQDAPAPSSSRGGSRGGGVAETSRPQAERYRDEHDGGPAQPAIDVATLIEPTPKAEPRARYGNNSNYSVLGKDYRVLNDSRGYVERGIASWYGNKFHGYMTSSLEPYDMYQFSAAHKTLPLPTYARVTNLDNGKSVVVRINDRGPFHDNRLIDLSYAAAVRIGIWPKGTGVVEVRAIDPAKPEATPAPLPKTVTAEAASARIYLQLGAYGDRANADRVASAARKGGIDQVDVAAADVNGRTVHRVRVGPLADVAAADALTPRIERLGFGAPRVAIER